jgi:hypothetical protein
MISDYQATVAVLQQVRSEAALKQKRVDAFTAVGEIPPAHLVSDLCSDRDFLSYLETLV